MMCYESPKQKDPKNKSLFTVHSSFVFTVQKEGKESQKTLSLDLNLEEMKPKEGTIRLSVEGCQRAVQIDRGDGTISRKRG